MKLSKLVLALVIPLNLLGQNENGSVSKRAVSLSNVEFQPFYSFGTRKFVVSKNNQAKMDYENYCSGHCGRYIRYPVEVRSFSTVGMNSNFSINRIYLMLTTAYERHEQELYYRSGFTKAHPHVPFGSITDYYSEEEFFSYTDHRMVAGLGFGIRLIKPNKRFNIIPMFKFTGSFSGRLNVHDEYFTKHRVYYWDQSLDPSYNVEWDSTFSSSRFSVYRESYDFSAGCLFTARPTKDLQINLGFTYGLRMTRMIELPNPLINDKVRFRFTFGLGYLLPFKMREKRTELFLD
jgi:hypothetical protein